MNTVGDGPAFQSVLQHYLDRLHAAIVRSPLLNASPGPLGRGSRIDLTHLDLYKDGQADQLLRRLMSGRHSVNLRPDWQAWDEDEQHEANLARLYRQMERKLIREADKIERETGNRSLWLGYPLLYVANPEDRDQSILAPVLLWPVRVALDPSRQWGLVIERDKAAEEPEFNKIMRAWVERCVGVRLEPADNWPRQPEDWAEQFEQWMDRLKGDVVPDLAAPLESVVQKSAVPKQQRPCIYHAAVLGVMRWQNQAITDDLEKLIKIRHFEQEAFPALMGGRDVTNIQASLKVSEEDRHHVWPADYSQEQAVLKARQKPGVVVHGPPGTGKSQTITNIVADALARHKKVLVVCQKRAALDVVAERLKAAGLSDLFLNVHDATSDREPIIDLLSMQISALLNGSAPVDHRQKRRRLCQQIESLEQELDLLHRAFHAPRRWGLSFQQTMAKLIRLENEGIATEEDQHLGKLLARSDWPQLEALEPLLMSLADLFVRTRPLTNLWRYRQSDFRLTPEARRQVQRLCEQLNETATAHDRMLAESEDPLIITTEPMIFRGAAEQVLGWLEALRPRLDLGAILRHIRQMDRDPAYAELVQKTQDTADRLARQSIDDRIAALVPNLNQQECQRVQVLLDGVLHYRGMWLRSLFKSYRRHRDALLPLLRSWGVPFRWNDLEALQKVLKRYVGSQVLHSQLRELEAFEIAPEWSTGDVPHLIERANRLRNWQKLLQDLQNFAQQNLLGEALLEVLRKGDLETLTTFIRQLTEARDRCEPLARLEIAIAAWQPVMQKKFLIQMRDTARQGKPLGDVATQLLRDFDHLDELQQYERLLDRETYANWELINRLVTEHADNVNDGEVLGRRWISMVQRSALMAWRREAIKETPDVEDIHSDRLNRHRQELRNAIKEKMRLEAGAVVASWLDQQRAWTDKPWSRILIKRGRNAKRLREVVEYGQAYGLFDLRPCWLTNPDTACQLLPLVEGLFDVVVFDEASQLPVEQAAPVLYRGRRIIVAGDEHQLPPTSFFSIRAAADDEEPAASGEEDADAQTVDQILDRHGIELARNATDLLELSKQVLPNHVLKVHYRSRHPALIEFSNWAFYKGDLEAAHPVWGVPKPESAPICIHRVNGVYDSQSNRDEARYIVNLLDHIWSQEGEPPTIGIVTFNQQQEQLIETKLDERAFYDRAFRSQLEQQRNRKDGEQDVGFFIKNLESVQGDERDLIIFSTTFGPTERGDHGTFRRFFGPLTQQGGERRLNVAVTRSREGMVIVTSMPFEKISDCASGVLPDQKIKARDFLQSYMFYSDAVAQANLRGVQHWLDQAAKLSATQRGGRRSTPLEFDSALEEQVYERLVAAGYQVDTQVGEAGFRIDLAVRHPDADRGYLLGIECDGATYHSGHAARTRDVWRESILRNYGWEIFRIWSTRWWTRADQVMDELLQTLRDREQLLHDGTSRGLTSWIPEPEQLLDETATEPALTGRKTATKPAKAHARSAHRRARCSSKPTAAPSPKDNGSLKQLRLQPTFHTLDGSPGQWAERLKPVLISPSSTAEDFAAWQDDSGLVYRMTVERRKGRRLICIQQVDDVLEHCGLPAVDEAKATVLCEELAAVDGHGAIMDWFRHLQAELFPEIWQ